MEAIEGIRILEKVPIYSITPIGLIIFIIIIIAMTVSLIITLEEGSKVALFSFCISIIIGIILGLFVETDKLIPWFNYYKGNKYTIEIINPQAWIEIAPNYTVEKELYENIYVITDKEN